MATQDQTNSKKWDARYLTSVPHDTSYYAKCLIGGSLACGLTHLAMTPLDITKTNMQVLYAHISTPLTCAVYCALLLVLTIMHRPIQESIQEVLSAQCELLWQKKVLLAYSKDGVQHWLGMYNTH